jgi:hypothetical protein
MLAGAAGASLDAGGAVGLFDGFDCDFETLEDFGARTEYLDVTLVLCMS